MMMGALLALLLANRRVDHWISGRVGKRLAAAAGIACFVGWILLCLSLSLSNPLTYHGGLMFVSFLSAGSIMAVTIDTPLRRLASHRTLCWSGARVYPIYLLHFPIFIILSPVRLHAYLPWPHSYQDLRWATLVLGSALAIALAGLSQRYLESPIRSGTRLPGRQFTFAAIGSVLVLLTLIAYTPFRGTDDHTLSLQHLARDANRERVRNRKVWDASPASCPGGGRFPVVVRVDGPDRLGQDPFDVQPRPARAGCGSAHGGVVDYLGLHDSVSAVCPSLVKDITQEVRELHPTSVVITTSGRDLADWTFPDGSKGHLGQPAFDRWMAGQVQQVADAAARQGIPVVWLLEPHMRANAFSTRSWRDFPENDPARMDRLNALITRAVDRLPKGSRVTTLDLGAFARRHPGGEFDPGFRPDGAHFSIPGILDIARWLGPDLMAREAAHR